MSQSKIDFPQPLTERYRPKRVADFIGLIKPKKIMEAFVHRPFDAAFLFVGQSGVGKTTFAMAVANQIQAETHLIPSRSCDLEMVETVTRMCYFAAFNFTTGKPAAWHAVICDEADQITNAAQQAFLSKLDATAKPPSTVFFFTCNSTATLEDRFLSRCRILPFERDTLEGEIEHYLRRIYKKEGGRHPLDFEAIAKASSYNVRDALNKIEMELMIGTDRDDLPSEDIKIVENHTHSCPKCHQGYKHNDPLCELPFRHICEPCGGAKTIGTLRAQKAWTTIRKNIAEEIEREKGAKPCRTLPNRSLPRRTRARLTPTS
jgi:replication-associated recombination protein RarA